MTKLIYHVVNAEGKEGKGVANPLSYARFVDVLSDWLGWSFTIVGTDRYTLDVEHERTRTTPTNGQSN